MKWFDDHLDALRPLRHVIHMELKRTERKSSHDMKGKSGDSDDAYDTDPGQEKTEPENAE